MKKFLVFAIFLAGCCGKQNCPPPYPPPYPILPPDVIIPPKVSKVEKCFKFIVSENYPYCQGPDLRWEMSWKW